MSILKVARMGHPVLRQPCRELSEEEILSAPVRRLVADMRETMGEYGGVGIAAPQVHEPLRVALVEFGEDNTRYEVPEPQPLLVVFNARVKVLDESRAGYWEGCLSVPGLRGFVERPSRIQVDYLDEEAEPRSLIAEGFLATVFQHELDHLDGVLYVDRVTPGTLSFVEEHDRFGRLAEPAADD